MKKNNNNKNNKIRREENIEKSQLQEIFICIKHLYVSYKKK